MPKAILKLGKIFTNVQIFGTSCTYRIKIIPLLENSVLDVPLPGSAIVRMGCTIVSPGVCQLEIPTQLLNSQRRLQSRALSVDDQNSTSLQPANRDCYLQDSSDENFETSGHQFLVTVLPFQRIYQCDKNHFWSETDQLCKSCNDHNVICGLGEYIQGCDVLGLNITCVPCPIPENTNPDTFTWGDNCEILPREIIKQKKATVLSALATWNLSVSKPWSLSSVLCIRKRTVRPMRTRADGGLWRIRKYSQTPASVRRHACGDVPRQYHGVLCPMLVT